MRIFTWESEQFQSCQGIISWFLFPTSSWLWVMRLAVCMCVGTFASIYTCASFVQDCLCKTYDAMMYSEKRQPSVLFVPSESSCCSVWYSSYPNLVTSHILFHYSVGNFLFPTWCVQGCCLQASSVFNIPQKLLLGSGLPSLTSGGWKVVTWILAGIKGRMCRGMSSTGYQFLTGIHCAVVTGCW